MLGESIHIGDVTISIGKIIYIAVVILLTFLFVKTVRFFVHRFINKSSITLRVDPTKYNFIKNALSFIIYSASLFIIVYSIPELRAISLTLFAGAGILAAIIGFASQAAFSNIISGLFIVIFKPFRVGDVITVGKLFEGTVEDITMRHTVLKDFENQRIIMPNSVISAETVINCDINDQHIRKHLHFTVEFDSDIDLVRKIIQQECLEHPKIQDYRSADQRLAEEDIVPVRVIAWLEYGLKIRAYCWTYDFNDAWELQCDLYEKIPAKFKENGIKIAYPKQTITLNNETATKQGK
jgi:small-conductance mechanosensitive channel